jgi:hypothetical protein
MEEELRIGWKWDTEERWHFHVTNKQALWKMLNDRQLSIRGLYDALQVNEDWLEVKEGEKRPHNYEMFYYLFKKYKSNYRKLKPPILYRLAVMRVLIICIALYKEDTAYTERMGGAVEYIIDHAEDWEGKSKEDRLLLLRDLKQWWEEEDWRARTKGIIGYIFDFIIDQYEHEPFVEKSINFWVDSILLNKSKWNRCEGWFNPEKWYPRGKGQVNYLVHGRTC